MKILLALLLATPAMAQLSAWPASGVVVNQSTTQVLLTEPSWVSGGGIPGSPVITMTGGTGASIVSQTEINNVFAVPGAISVIVNTGTANGTLTFTNPVDGLNVAIPVRAALTHYVEHDGGTSQQCNGLVDVPYPGSGSGLGCRLQDVMSLWATTGAFCNDGTPGSACWRWNLAGGDTAIVRDCIQYSATTPFAAIPGSNGTCATGSFGPGASDWGWSLAGDNNNGGWPFPPSGTASQHTKILGGNFAACTAQSSRAQLIGRYAVGEVMKLEGVNYVDVACFDVSDQSSCGRAAQVNSCSHTPPYDNFAAAGIGFSNTTTNVTITDFRLHGLAVAGELGPTGDGVVQTDIQIIGNAGAGWNADHGDGTTGLGHGLMQNFDISWNGCAEEYPIVDALPYNDCTDDFGGGYGDGFGTATTTSMVPGWQQTFNIGVVSFNTQDGLDALHLVGNGSSMTINRTSAFSNMGQQLKIGGSPGVMENFFVGANCFAMQNPIPGTPTGFNTNLTDYCRADDEPIIVAINDGDTTSVLFGTIYGSGETGGGDLEGLVCTSVCTAGTAALVQQNVLQVGFPDYGGSPHRYFDGTGISGGPWTQTGTIISNNGCFGVASGSCSIPGETSLFTAQPQLADTTFQIFGTTNVTPVSASNVLGIGITKSGVTVDLNGVTRPNPPSIGALEFSSGSTVATPTASPVAGTYATTQTVSLSTATGGATICYTIDGSTPAAATAGTCSHGTTYSTAITIATTTTINALGTLSGATNSGIFTGLYTITPLVAAPSFLKGTIIVKGSGAFK